MAARSETPSDVSLPEIYQKTIAGRGGWDRWAKQWTVMAAKREGRLRADGRTDAWAVGRPDDGHVNREV